MSSHASAGAAHPTHASWLWTSRSLTVLLWLVWLASLALGGAGLYQRITQGHLPAGYGSYVPWGLWVACYFHAVGLAGGAFVVGAMAYILDLPGFRQRFLLRTVTVFSVAALVPALLAVWLDLGHMERVYRIFTSPAFTSMMAFNAWMYVAFLVAAGIAWLLSFRSHSHELKPVLCLAVFLSIVYPSQSGVLFGVVDAKAYWHSALFPMLFLASAIASGAAALLVVRGIIGPLDRCDSAEEVQHSLRLLRGITLGGLIVYFVFEFCEFSIVLWNPDTHAPAIELVLWGPYRWVFWIVHLAIGGVVPLALLVRRSPCAWIVAGVLVAVSFVSARLNVLIPGQAVGEIRGLQDAFQHKRLSYIYHATLMEYLVGFAFLAVGMAVFFIGHRINVALSSRDKDNG